MRDLGNQKVLRLGSQNRFNTAYERSGSLEWHMNCDSQGQLMTSSETQWYLHMCRISSVSSSSEPRVSKFQESNDCVLFRVSLQYDTTGRLVISCSKSSCKVSDFLNQVVPLLSDEPLPRHIYGSAISHDPSRDMARHCYNVFMCFSQILVEWDR